MLRGKDHNRAQPRQLATLAVDFSTPFYPKTGHAKGHRVNAIQCQLLMRPLALTNSGLMY
jgi:hypothetical protein